jgi:predicted nucleic acid-binding protein
MVGLLNIGAECEPKNLHQSHKSQGNELMVLDFRQYRQRGGTKTGVLPDFFIGAHAQADGYQLLTRDAGRYKTYFPKIKLICP